MDTAEKQVIVLRLPNCEGLVPSCGHMAGMFARTDWRRGVYKAPANAEVRVADTIWASPRLGATRYSRSTPDRSQREALDGGLGHATELS